MGMARIAYEYARPANLPTDGLCFVFHPDAWEDAELLETNVGGDYKMNDGEKRAPINRQQRTLWGVQVALSTSLSPCQALLFHRSAVELKEREGVTIDWSENTYDSAAGKNDWEKNLIRWRCEGRWAFNIYQPNAIVDIDVCQGT